MVWMTVAAPSPGDGALLDNCIARIAQGDRDALAALYERTRPAVYGVALSILKNAHDAEDVLQDTYVQVWLAAGSYRGRGKAMAWLMTIVRNLSLDRIRQRQRTETVDWDGWQERFTDLPAVTVEDRMALAALLTALGDQEREIVALHALTGLRHREIAALLDLPLATVLSKYSWAMKKLRLAWKEAD